METRPNALRGRIFAALLILSILILVVATSASAARPRAEVHHLTKRAIVPVLAEAGGASLGERLRGAKVRVYAVSGRKGAAKRRLVGHGRLGSSGVDLVRLNTRKQPRRLLVATSGGRLLGKRFGGHLSAFSPGGRSVFLSPLSTLAATYGGMHGGLSPQQARGAVRRYYRIPGFFDFATDLADRHLFDGRDFVRRARSHGGFDRYMTRLASRLKKRKGAKAASVQGTASGACWEEAAQTTAGFAELMGFTGLPSEPTLTSCPGGSAEGSSVIQRGGIVKSVLTLEVFGAVVGVASLIYGIVAGQSSSAELQAIKEELNEIQAELIAIQGDLGGLQAQVTEVDRSVVEGTSSEFSTEAAGTINQIKYANSKTLVLLGDATQILCEGKATCEKPASGTKNLGKAIDLACDDYTPTCENFYSELYVTSRRLSTARPLEAVEELGDKSLGSAFAGGPPAPGIVQFALQEGGIGNPFFTTADASSARLEWAYYTLYSALDQSTYATVLGMSVGQPLPNAKSAHPPALTVSDISNYVNEMNEPIGNMIAAFPNMPDGAVFVTNYGAENNDPPYLLPQTVGGVERQQRNEAGETVTISPSAVASGSLPTSSGKSVPTQQSKGTAPLVLTPASANGENWRILPSPGESRPPLPAISTAPFSDWRAAWSEATNPLPQWNESTHKVERSIGGLRGPLPDLYAAYKPSGSQTAGQWMTTESGIESTILTPQGTGYPATEKPSGVVAYKAKSGDTSSEPGLGFTTCTPAGDEECLLPTWQGPKVDPFAQTSSNALYNTGSKQLNTGLFDLNNGLVIANQQGHAQNPERGFPVALESNETAFLNQYPNWEVGVNLRGVPFYGFLEAMNGQSGSIGQYASGEGRPVLFTREQTSNDCFYWDGVKSGASNGVGCLIPRTTSGQILP